MQVTVYNTVGSNEQTVEFNGTTRAELQEVLNANNIPFADMDFTIGETQNTLGTPQSQTPTGDFTLFLLPREVKSGVEDDIDFEDIEDDDSSDNDESETAQEEDSILSLETQALIKGLEDSKLNIDAAIAALKNKKITDPRTLALQRQAQQLMSGRRY